MELKNCSGVSSLELYVLKLVKVEKQRTEQEDFVKLGSQKSMLEN